MRLPCVMTSYCLLACFLGLGWHLQFLSLVFGSRVRWGWWRRLAGWQPLLLQAPGSVGVVVVGTVGYLLGRMAPVRFVYSGWPARPPVHVRGFHLAEVRVCRVQGCPCLAQCMLGFMVASFPGPGARAHQGQGPLVCTDGFMGPWSVGAAAASYSGMARHSTAT